jgi:hypothetical protein
MLIDDIPGRESAEILEGTFTYLHYLRYGELPAAMTRPGVKTAQKLYNQFKNLHLSQIYLP